MLNMRALCTMVLSFLLLFMGSTTAQTEEVHKRADAVFKSFDKDGDGKISREEWEAADNNKDDKITRKEWQRFHYKSDGTLDGWSVIRWYDLNNDGFMDRDEFRRNFRNR